MDGTMKWIDWWMGGFVCGLIDLFVVISNLTFLAYQIFFLSLSNRQHCNVMGVFVTSSTVCFCSCLTKCTCIHVMMYTAVQLQVALYAVDSGFSYPLVLRWHSVPAFVVPLVYEGTGFLLLYMFFYIIYFFNMEGFIVWFLTWFLDNLNFTVWFLDDLITYITSHMIERAIYIYIII